MARITLTLEVTDEQQAQLINRFLTEARATVSDEDDDEAAVPAVPAHGQVDVRGVPWHPDYHAATQTKTTKGEWKKKKGGDSAAIEAYERQFTVPALPATAAAIEAPVEVPAFLQRPAAPVAPVAAMPTMPAAMPMPIPAAAAAPVVTYDDLITVFNETGARIGNERVASECLKIYPKLGITDANVLSTDETLRAKLVAELRALN